MLGTALGCAMVRKTDQTQGGIAMIISRKRFLSLAAAALAGAGLFAATARAADKVIVGALRFTSHSPSFIAFERGYFKDAGLDVQFKFFQAAQPMAVAIASGDVDFGVTAVTAGLFSLAEKGAVKIVGGALHEDPKIDGSAILASMKAYEAGLKTPKDIKGHSFAITQAGSSFHYMLSRVAEKEGFSLKDVKLVPLHKVGAIIGALKTGQVDSWIIVPHIAKALDGAKKAKIIGWVNRYAPDYQVTVITANANLIKKNPDEVKRFLAAFSKGAADFNAGLVDKTKGEEEAAKLVELIHKYVYASKPLAKAAKSIRRGAMRISPDAQLDARSIQHQLDWFKSQGMVKPKVTLDMLIDPSFAKVVK